MGRRAAMSGNSVQDHYAGDDTGSAMASRILTAVRAVYGQDAAITPETLAPLDHFNSRGLAATQALGALLDPHAGESLLDIGGGVGGPARWIATRYGCTVAGVDVTAAFCEAARLLNAACGVADRVRIVDGTALALPFPDASFDRAYAHGVLTSIADKLGVYREACRDATPEYFAALTAVRRTVEAEGLPPLGMQVLMGDRLRPQRLNGYHALRDGRARMVEIVARKPD